MTASAEAPTMSTPGTVAQEILALEPPITLVFDCDGVLAPLTSHADDSVLLDGVDELLDALARVGPHHGLTTAILSGRSLAGLEQFRFSDHLLVLGSYGGEQRNRPTEPLDAVEADRLRRLDDAAEQARSIAGDGAWVERKPASVVLHVRQANTETGEAAIRRLAALQADIPGSDSHDGAHVLEVLARPHDKGSALRQLRDDTTAASMVYVGDDVPDEDAFAVLGANDVSIKVGTGATRANRRLRDPEAVRALLEVLVESLER